jgi:hypothetical protein
MILKQVYYKINLRISLKPDGQLEKRHQIIGNTFIDFRHQSLLLQYFRNNYYFVVNAILYGLGDLIS